MRKKILVLALLLLLGSVGGGLAWAMKYEPAFYRQPDPAPGDERKQSSTELFSKLTRIANHFVDGQGKWSYELSEQEIHSFFEEDFVRLGDAEALRKLGITRPRVRFDEDRIRVAFRYGTGFWSAVLSYDLRVWLAPKEVNVVVVEIVNRQIGGLPIASQTMLNELKELFRSKNMDVSWYRHDNHPVAVIRLPSNRSRHFAQLLALDVAPGRLTISGQCNEPGVHAMLEGE